MSYHFGAHYHAICDHDDGEGRCPEFVLPPVRWDPTPSGGPLTPRADAYNLAIELGWDVEGNLTLCPKHRRPPKTDKATAVDPEGSDPDGQA